jgi:hypothetical protein
VPAPGDFVDGDICGMIGRGNRSTRRKPALCSKEKMEATGIQYNTIKYNTIYAADSFLRS